MKIAILGFGTVGTGVYDAAMRTKGALEVARILDMRTIPGYEAMLTNRIEDILSDPQIELVVETMGGLEPAFTYVMAAIKAGKHVVSANKQLISGKFSELTQAAAEYGVKLRYTASSGGGIPWLYNLRRTARCDEVLSVSGIVNGTTNFILDTMYSEGGDYADALKEAQRLGYAEADPTADVNGYDAQRKCAISASIAFDTLVDEALVLTEGIQHFGGKAAAAAAACPETADRVLKLLMHAGRQESGIYAYVAPTLVKRDSLAANVPKNFNLITLDAKFVGEQCFYGQGAGKDPTGTSVVQDALDIALGIGEEQAYASQLKVENNMAQRSFFVYDNETTVKRCSVQEMFSWAEAARKAGAEVFFSEIAEDR